MRTRSTQGRRIIAVLKQKPLTYAQMLRLVHLVVKDGLDPHREALEDAAYAVGELYETDDPVQMGWVGSDGRP